MFVSTSSIVVKTNIELKNSNRPRFFFVVFEQWKEELRMVDDRVRIVVTVKDQASSTTVEFDTAAIPRYCAITLLDVCRNH